MTQFSLRSIVVCLVLASLAGACKRTEELTSRQLHLAEPTTGKPILDAAECDVTTRVDLVRAREQPELKALREQWLGNSNGYAFRLARESGLDLEQNAVEAILCEKSASKTNRYFVFKGDFAPDTLERVSRVAPHATKVEGWQGRVLRVGNTFLGLGSKRLVFCDDVSTLEEALSRDFLVNGADALLSVRMTPARAKAAFKGFTQATGIADTEWDSLILSVSGDGETSEIRFVTRSNVAATKLLEYTRSLVDEIAHNPQSADLPGAQVLSAEAMDRSVALRCRAPLGHLLKLLEQISPRKHAGHP